jgi:two-component system, cell cycle sensor histidine kinase and response regulator CckA
MEAAGTSWQCEESNPNESDDRFCAIFSQAAVGIAQVSLEGKWLMVNRRFREMLGYSEGELLHKNWQDITHPDDLEAVWDGRRRLLAGEIASHTMEKRYICKDGSVIWGRLHRALVRNHDGQPAYFVAVVEDTTEKVQAERALKESEQRLALAQSAARLFVWEQDLRSGVIFCAGEHARLYGFSPDRPQLKYVDWLKAVHCDDRERVQAAVAEAVERMHIFHLEFRAHWLDGSVRWLESKAAVLIDDSGRPSRLVGVNIDITDRKQAEAALYENILQYKEVFDNISVCVFVLDVTPEGRFKFLAFNPAEEALVGLTTAQVSGKFIEEIFPEDLANERIAKYQRCIDHGRAIKFEDELKLPGQKPRYFHSNLIPLRNSAGVIYRVIGACVETTDFKRTQEEALAKQNLETLGVLAGGIAHDFNNILGGIHAQAELIETDLPTGLAALGEVQQIKTAAIRGSEIVRELMTFAGQDESYFEGALDISQLIGEMLSLLKISISKHALLKVNLAEHLPAILCNAAQIRQVVMNLVINASEAILQQDGAITITTAHIQAGGRAGMETPTELAQGDYVLLEVSDTGGGIAEDVTKKIFDPFFTTKFAGRGMGLAVVHRIVHGHRGAIRVESTLGQGTRFRVFLPCSVEPSSDTRGPRIGIVEQASPQKGTILIVEDDGLLRGSVSKLLRRMGFVVVEARDGSEAMEALRAHESELDGVLLDFTLPGTSSVEVFDAARRMLPDLKVVVTSAYSKETVVATFGPRVHEFVRKPFRLGELMPLFAERVST